MYFFSSSSNCDITMLQSRPEIGVFENPEDKVHSFQACRNNASPIIVITAIRFAPLSSKCGDSMSRNAEKPRSHQGSLGVEGGAMVVMLLPFHPAILAAVAVFLINMLILHGHSMKLWNAYSIHVHFPETVYARALLCYPGCSRLTATCNTKHLRPG